MKNRTFPHFPQEHNTLCPICKTNEDKECVLIPIDGTSEDRRCEAQPVHLDCITDVSKMQYNHDVGVIYISTNN